MEESIELGNLFPHLIEEIFIRIPLKSLTRLKCVSKNWRSFITRLCHSNPPTTASGLVVFFKENRSDSTLHQSTFIKLQHQNVALEKEGCFCPLYTSSVLHNYPCLIDSCKGLLLYATSDDHSWTYHVSVPFTSQFISLPPAHKVSRPSCASLAFNGFQFSIFRVFCFFWDEYDIASGTMNSLSFSSNSSSWREQQARLMNSQLLLEEGFVRGQCFRPNVYMKEKFYWLWSKFMLVYDENKELFNLIRLPTNKSKRTILNAHLSQLLWESEGRIHFCDVADEGIYLWEYTDDDEGHSDYKAMDCDSVWRFKRLIVLDELKSQKNESVYWFNDAEKLRMELSWTSRIRPCAFNEDLQVLYLLLLPGSIVTYSFETQRFARVWSFGELGDNYFMCKAYPFLFSSLGV